MIIHEEYLKNNAVYLRQISSRNNTLPNLSAMTEEDVCQKHRIPLKKEQLLNGAGRAINCLAWDKSGARVISGSSDHIVRMYDFGGMTVEHDPFQC